MHRWHAGTRSYAGASAMAANDPNSDDAEYMGRGLAVILMIIGALMAGHFGLRLQEAFAKDTTNALGVGYVGLFVVIGLGMLALGLRRFHEASDESIDAAEEADSH